jgi:hypothetical protein
MGEQQSSIDRLPNDIREKLQELLRDPRVTQLDATARINAILEEEGHDQRLSKSAVNRYYQQMKEAGAKLRQSREVAQMWIGRLGAAPQGQVGNLVNEILRTLSFDMALMLQDGELNVKTAPGVVEMLKGLSLTMQRLEKAASENVKREEEIRKHALEEAASIAGTSAKKGGLSDGAVETIKKEILGIAK